MISLRRATSEDFEAVYSKLLVQFRNPYLTRSDYARLFQKQWPSGEDWHGFLLVDGDVVVGFLAVIFSTRLIRGSEHRFCNINHWIVEESHRNHSLRLLFQAMRLSDCTLVSFTPIPRVVPIYAKTGWKNMDNRLAIIPMLPSLSLPRRYRLIFSPGEIKDRLQGAESQIFEDHEPFKCRHAFIAAGTGGCYVVYTVVPRRRLPFVFIHYIGDLKIFMDCLHHLRWRLCLRERAIALLIDDRLLKENRPFATIYFSGEARFFYTATDLTKYDIDSLYSEYIVVNV